MSVKFSKWTILPAAVLLLGTAAMAQNTSTPQYPEHDHPGAGTAADRWPAQGKSAGPHCQRRAERAIDGR